MTRSSTPNFRALGVCALTAVAVSTAARADEGNAITACISKDGRMRMLSGEEQHEADRKRERSRDASLCPRGERLVIWNIIGPAGPPGPRGPEGPAGAPGAPGLGFIGIQYYTVGNGDLRPVGGGAFGTSFGPPPGGTFSTSAAPLLAGIHLPQGATVLAIRSHVLDNSTSDLTIELIEQPLAGTMPLLLSSSTTTGAAGAPYAVDGTLSAPHPVDNALFHYFVRVSPSPGWTATSLQVLGVTVVYTLGPLAGS